MSCCCELTAGRPSSVVNLAAGVRRENILDIDSIVLPCVLLVPGVLSGSKGPLYYSSGEIERSTAAWNGVPVTLDHPSDADGRMLSARNPGVWERVGLGRVQNARWSGDRLHAELVLFVPCLYSVAGGLRVYSRLVRGELVEVSTGLMVDRVGSPGTEPLTGRQYDAIATNFRPDHLAVLPDDVGACSIADGCGAGAGLSGLAGVGNSSSVNSSSPGVNLSREEEAWLEAWMSDVDDHFTLLNAREARAACAPKKRFVREATPRWRFPYRPKPRRD